jgi:hypothetical protein
MAELDEVVVIIAVVMFIEFEVVTQQVAIGYPTNEFIDILTLVFKELPVLILYNTIPCELPPSGSPDVLNDIEYPLHVTLLILELPKPSPRIATHNC